VVADLDALAAKAPDAAELRRIVAPLGATCLRRGGAWIVERIPVEPGLGEWTHADHGPDGNPVSPDRLVSYPRGIQWHAETGDAASNMRIGAGVVVRAVTFWEDTGGGRRTRTGQAIEAREAGSGILRWRLAESPEQAARRGTVHEQSWCLADNLAVGLIGGDGPHAQAIDLRSGTVVRTYDQGLVVGRPLGEEEHKARQRDFPWGHNAYPHGFFHLHLDGAVVQGSSADDRGRVAALDLKSGERRWIWEAAPGQRIAALAADRGMVVAGLGGDPFSIGIHYRNRLVRLTALVGIDLASGTVRWTSQVVDGMRVSQLTCADGGVHVHDVEGATHFMSPKRFLRLDLATGEVVYDNPLAKTNTGRWGNSGACQRDQAGRARRHDRGAAGGHRAPPDRLRRQGRGLSRPLLDLASHRQRLAHRSIHSLRELRRRRGGFKLDHPHAVRRGQLSRLWTGVRRDHENLRLLPLPPRRRGPPLRAAGACAAGRRPG